MFNNFIPLLKRLSFTEGNNAKSGEKNGENNVASIILNETKGVWLMLK